VWLAAAANIKQFVFAIALDQHVVAPLDLALKGSCRSTTKQDLHHAGGDLAEARSATSAFRTIEA